VCIVGNEYRGCCEVFQTRLYRRVKEGGHDTLLKHKSIWNQILVADTFVNEVLIANDVSSREVESIRVESLAMSQLGRNSRIIDLTIVLSNYLTYIKNSFKGNLHLVSAHTLKKQYLGKLPKKKDGDAKEMMLKKFEAELNIDLSYGKNDDGVDAFCLANKIVLP
jgi:hypothetical protein